MHLLCNVVTSSRSLRRSSTPRSRAPPRPTSCCAWARASSTRMHVLAINHVDHATTAILRHAVPGRAPGRARVRVCLRAVACEQTVVSHSRCTHPSRLHTTHDEAAFCQGVITMVRDMCDDAECPWPTAALLQGPFQRRASGRRLRHQRPIAVSRPTHGQRAAQGVRGGVPGRVCLHASRVCARKLLFVWIRLYANAAARASATSCAETA